MKPNVIFVEICILHKVRSSSDNMAPRSNVLQPPQDCRLRRALDGGFPLRPRRAPRSLQVVELHVVYEPMESVKCQRQKRT